MKSQSQWKKCLSGHMTSSPGRSRRRRSSGHTTERIRTRWTCVRIRNTRHKCRGFWKETDLPAISQMRTNWPVMISECPTIPFLSGVLPESPRMLQQVPVPHYYWKAILKIKTTNGYITDACAVGSIKNKFLYSHYDTFCVLCFCIFVL